MSAVCVRCGEVRDEWDAICPGCGHRPDDEGRLVAWLLSSENLQEQELQAVRARVLAGESIRPSERMLERARRALGRHFATDEGLTGGQRLALLGASILLTPLLGWVLFAYWYNRRPRAAIQSLALSLPVSLAFAAWVLYLR
jgi:hypothetical protein